MAISVLDRHGGYLLRYGKLGGWIPSNLQFDPLANLLGNTQVVYDLGWVPAESSLQGYLDRGEPNQVLFGLGHLTEPGYQSQYDFNTYGSPLASLTGLGHLFAGQPVIGFDQGDQYPVRHDSYRGTLDATEGSEYPFVLTTPISVSGGHQHPRLGFTPKVWGTGSHNYSSTYVYTTGSLGGLDFHKGSFNLSLDGGNWRLEDVYMYLMTTFRADDWWRYGGEKFRFDFDLRWYTMPFEITGLRFQRSSTSVELTYHLRWERGPMFMPDGITQIFDSSDAWAEFDVRWFMDYKPATFTPRHLGVFWHYDILPAYDLGTPTVTWVCTDLGGNIGTLQYYIGVSQRGDTLSRAVPQTLQYFSNPLPSRGVVSQTQIDVFLARHRLENLVSLINKADIVPSSFLSCADALNSLNSQIDTNIVETIGEASELLELMPDLSDAVDAVVALRQGRVLHSIRDLLDFATSLRLQDRFAWQPSIDLVVNYLPAAVDLMRRMSDAGDKPVVRGYGRFDYDFPTGTYGRESIHLTTRTMVRVKSSDLALYRRILGVKAFGLLPSPGALWDLIPFSFVLDWFLDVGGRLKAAENVLLMTLLGPVSYTHSYTITSPLTDEELATDGFQIGNLDSSVRPVLRYYVRDVSMYPAPPTQGRFDFGLPDRPPNWLTFWSLAWQVLT